MEDATCFRLAKVATQATFALVVIGVKMDIAVLLLAGRLIWAEIARTIVMDAFLHTPAGPVRTLAVIAGIVNECSPNMCN